VQSHVGGEEWNPISIAGPTSLGGNKFGFILRGDGAMLD
jgi:hypothetical protein